VGDQVLASVGATLRSVLRTHDFAGRKGGEEFAVLLPDTDMAAALEIAEHASTVDRLERLAGAALYLAKRQGRDRVELAEPAPAEVLAPSANGSAPVPAS
jgi:PleD family two-component response regulator